MQEARNHLARDLLEEGISGTGLDGSGTTCQVTFENIGGFALIQTDLADGRPYGEMRVAPDLVWYRGDVSARVMRNGGKATFSGRSASTAAQDPNTLDPPTIYVRVSCSDVNADQNTTAYFCIQQGDDTGWRVKGAAVVDETGRIVRSGAGWGRFITDAGQQLWPEA